MNKKRIEKLINEGEEVKSTKYTKPSHEYVDLELFEKWKTKTLNYLSNNLSENNTFLNDFKTKVSGNNPYDVEIGIGILKAILDELNEGYAIEIATNSIDLFNLENIFNNFHNVVKPLAKRRKNHDPIIINDEIDVQDLIHALFRLFYDDIRPEEPIPSTGKNHTFIDFYIPKIKVGVEIKFGREKMNHKKLLQELNEDIRHYCKHSDMETLYFFIYDPNYRIDARGNLKNDLENTKDINVKVFFNPP